MVSILFEERIGIGLLITGTIMFLPICFLYLLSFECTTTATSEKKSVGSSITRGKTSFFVSTKHLIVSFIHSSSLRSIASSSTILCVLISQYTNCSFSFQSHFS
jgi:hypothetical protein